MTIYRACWILAQGPIGFEHVCAGETVLTLPEHAALPDAEMIEVAVAAAYDADIVSAADDDSRFSEADLRAALTIGDWRA